MLRGLPEKALLVTSGDVHTYPAVALQEAKGLRVDVAIVKRSLLNTIWCARFICKHYGLALPYENSQEASRRTANNNEA